MTKTDTQIGGAVSLHERSDAGIAAAMQNAQTSVTEVKLQVEAALQRQAKADAKSIKVSTSGGRVTLTGHASSRKAIENAAAAAWTAAGVTKVEDEIQIQ